jgi:hypothetical protein
MKMQFHKRLSTHVVSNTVNKSFTSITVEYRGVTMGGV